MRVEKTVFISYRRTNVFHALAIYQNLSTNDYDVFFDYDSIKSGDFSQIILNQIAARAHFIVLLTPSALERCNESGDWLRKEIEHAIDLKRNIVPLMFEGFSFNDVDKYLTGKMAVLKNYNALRVPADYFNAAMERLRNDYLNIALDTLIHPTPPMQRAQVAQIQAQAAKQPKPSEKLLNAEEWIEDGKKRFEIKDYDGAIASYSHAIRLNPKSALAYHWRGYVKQRKNDLIGALADYDEAIRLNPQDTDAYNNRGTARDHKGNLSGAIADYTEAIRLNPQFAVAYNNRGNARKAKGDLDNAIADYTEAIRLNPQLADAYYNRGLTRKAKGDLDNAIIDYTEAIRLNPQDAEAYNKRAFLYYQQGKLDAAIADYEVALRIDPNLTLVRKNLQIARDQKRQGK